MTDRSMNYDLDGIFSSRNQGQLVASEPAAQVHTRTPGLVPMQKTMHGYVEAPSYAGSAGLSGWMDGTTSLPVIGSVSNKVLLFGGVAFAAALFFVLRKK